METIQYFAYSVPVAAIYPQAAVEAAPDLNDVVARGHEAESVIYEVGLEWKACVRMYNENHIRYIFFALASSKPDPYSPPGMPIGIQPPPEDYETLRELLQTEVGANSSSDVKQCNV